MTDLRIVAVAPEAGPMSIPVDLVGYTKAQSDGIRMTLLRVYGHRQLELAPDGSRVTVHVPSNQRSIGILSLVSQAVASFCE